MSGNSQNWEQVAFPVGILALSVGLALIAHYVLFKVLGRVSRGLATLPEGSFKRRHGGSGPSWVSRKSGERVDRTAFDRRR